MNVEQARFNMIEQQIRPWDVLDQSVLALLQQVRREDFVPGERSHAFVDMEIPLAHGEAMWQPKMEARAIQELAIKPSDKILEVGTGSGHLTALLAKMGRHVYSVDLHPDFLAAAQTRLRAYGIQNVTLEEGNAAEGWPNKGPYDVIVMTGSLPTLPEKLTQQLAPGGRLFVVLGDAPVMEATLITASGPGVLSRVVLFETVLKPLHAAVQPERFRF